MAIKLNYDFNGIEVKNATMKVVRIFGSSKEGWNSLVGVYTQTKEIIPAVEKVEQVGFPGEPNYIPAVEAKEEYEVVRDKLIEEFNFPVPFQKDERGYKAIYDALMNKFGGVEV